MDNQTEIRIVRSQRKTTTLQIGPGGVVLVKAPLRMPERRIREFIEENKDWIKKRLSPSLPQNQKKEGEYLYLGRTLTLAPGSYAAISVRGNKLLFPAGLMFQKDKEITHWYIKEAKKIITEQVEKYAVEMGTSFKSITFSDTKSQWGRCTYDNRLQFNWRLVLAPQLVLNYVVVHELAHTLEKNHTQMFWMKVRRFNPSARQQIKWLKQNGWTLRT